jgi:OCT family organic anion transporter-like MFS transporter 23
LAAILPPVQAHGHSLAELEKELSRRPKKVCIVKVVGTRNLWKNIVVLCVNS